MASPGASRASLLSRRLARLLAPLTGLSLLPLPLALLALLASTALLPLTLLSGPLLILSLLALASRRLPCLFLSLLLGALAHLLLQRVDPAREIGGLLSRAIQATATLGVPSRLGRLTHALAQ